MVEDIHLQMNKVIFLIYLLFVSSVYAIDNNRLNKIIKLVNRYYIEDININKSTSVNQVMNKLDKYSFYIDEDTESNNKVILFADISFKIIDSKYLYIKVPYFSINTSEKIKKIITANTNNIQAIILDLKNNPGGIFKEAISTVDMFVDSGIIVSKRGRDVKNVTKYKARQNKTISKLPLYILINKNTASSAEIVSGALQDFKRATIVGDTTFGKGTIQALIYISSDKKKAIRLTVARYYLPKGRAVDNKIIPDIKVLNNQLNYTIQLLNNTTILVK